MTFFSIVNASDQDIDLTATIYSNWAIPMLDVQLTLKAKEVKSIHLHDWIADGKLPQDTTVCSDGGSDCMDLIHLQTALAGQPSEMTQLYYGTELEARVATGFITLEADAGFLPESDVLWGDYFYTNPVENFAQGQRLVRREANLSCADLCLRHSIRFLEGGGFSGGTKLTIWNWNGIPNRPSEFPTPRFDLDNAQIDVYSQQGELVEVIPDFGILPVQTILVSDLEIDQPFGWFDLTTFEDSAVAGYYRAMGKFSVGVPAWCLPCDPCNANGPCHEPGNPQCGTPACIPVRLKSVGNSQGILGEEFNLTFRYSGSSPATIEVSELPAGLTLQGRTIHGIPTEEKSFTIYATNDCGSDEIIVDFIPQPLDPTFLTLIKEVINDDGGTATAADFPLFAGNQSLQTGVRTLIDSGSYTVREQNQPGYTAGTWTGDCAPGGQITLDQGDDKICYITNDDQPATITLIKHVNGGTAQVRDFDLFAGSQQVTSGVPQKLAPGTYTASERNLPGYSASGWSGDCAANGTFTLTAGQDKVCEITNFANPAKITLIKHVINDDGGTAVVADFALKVGQQKVTSGVTMEMAPGSYVANEQNLPGYKAGNWGGDCAANGDVTLAAGEHKVCQITNDDIPATITLIKHVINDHGGTARVSDFVLSIGGSQVTSGIATELAAGSYTASEQNLPGYKAGNWGGDCAANGAVTLALGEHKVCEITNDDKPARITVIKHVVNDDGGSAVVSDFDLFVGNQSVTSGGAYDMFPGSYTVSEQNLPGYEAGSWYGDCAANGAITLVAGEHKTCEIVNDDIAVCDPTPSFAVTSSSVDFNPAPHNNHHQTTVTFNYRIDGEFDGEVQLYWKNGSSTYIKKRIDVDPDCDDPAASGRLVWSSGSKNHHPDHGARYYARLVVNGSVVSSIRLN